MKGTPDLKLASESEGVVGVVGFGARALASVALLRRGDDLEDLKLVPLLLLASELSPAFWVGVEALDVRDLESAVLLLRGDDLRRAKDEGWREERTA